MAALDFQEAAGLASENLQVIFQSAGDSIKTKLDAWLAGIARVLTDPASPAQRTVTDQIPVGLEVSAAIPNAKANQTQEHANVVSVYLWKTCKAIQLAGAGGRISSVQVTNLLILYNATWP